MMKDSTIFFFCVYLIFVKNTLAQYCCSRAPESYGILEAGLSHTTRYDPSVLQALSLPSPSFSIESDGLVINGAVEVSGSLPFTSAVSLEGVVPTVGKGSVLYNCGADEIGMYTDRPFGTLGYPMATGFPGHTGFAGPRGIGMY